MFRLQVYKLPQASSFFNKAFWDFASEWKFVHHKYIPGNCWQPDEMGLMNSQQCLQYMYNLWDKFYTFPEQTKRDKTALKMVKTISIKIPMRSTVALLGVFDHLCGEQNIVGW